MFSSAGILFYCSRYANIINAPYVVAGVAISFETKFKFPTIVGNGNNDISCYSFFCGSEISVCPRMSLEFIPNFEILGRPAIGTVIKRKLNLRINSDIFIAGCSLFFFF